MNHHSIFKIVNISMISYHRRKRLGESGARNLLDELLHYSIFKIVRASVGKKGERTEFLRHCPK